MRLVRRDVYAWKHHFIRGSGGAARGITATHSSRAGLFLSYDLKPLTADVPGVLAAREREMSLWAGYRREAAAGRGRIVPISGEAGVGRSSLLRKFEDVYEAN
jgi:hypothetical protein